MNTRNLNDIQYVYNMKKKKKWKVTQILYFNNKFLKIKLVKKQDNSKVWKYLRMKENNVAMDEKLWECSLLSFI